MFWSAVVSSLCSVELYLNPPEARSQDRVCVLIQPYSQYGSSLPSFPARFITAGPLICLTISRKLSSASVSSALSDCVAQGHCYSEEKL